MRSLLARAAGAVPNDDAPDAAPDLTGAITVRRLRLPGGGQAALREIAVRFGRATPAFLRPGVLAETYTSKPLVSVRGEGMFGELAVARLLADDGWDAVWVDGFHRAFWRAMPNRAPAVALPPAARARYDAIVAANGGRAAGFFDVMAWRDDRFLFVDYRGPGERPNRNEAAWVEAALAAGVAIGDLWVVRGSTPDDD